MSIDNIVQGGPRKIQYHNDTYVALPHPHNDEYGVMIFGQQNKDPEKVRQEIETVLKQYFRYRNHELINEKEEKPYPTGKLRVRRHIHRSPEGQVCRTTIRHNKTEEGKGYHPNRPNVDYAETPSNMSKSQYFLYFGGDWHNDPKGKRIYHKGKKIPMKATDTASKFDRDEFMRYLHLKRIGQAP